VIKPFIDVEKEQIEPLFFYSNSALFVGGSAKYYLTRAQSTLATPLIAVD